MKRLLLTLLLVGYIANEAVGQKIYFSDTSNKWEYMCVYDVTGPPWSQYIAEYEYQNDTLINGIKYSVITSDAQSLTHISQTQPTTAFVRDDTAARRVMFYLDDTTELVLYDWSLQVGDTMFYPQHICLVVAVDTIEYNGNSYIKQKLTPFRSLGSSHTFDVIEGFGSKMLDPFYTLYAFAFEPNCGMCEVTNNGIKVDFTSSVLYGCVLSVNNLDGRSIKTTLSPNPITEQTTVNIHTTIKIGQLTIYNSIGQRVYSTNISNQKQLTLPYHELLPGQYFYTLLDMENGTASNGRFEK